MPRTSTSVLSTATPVNLRFSTSQATQAPSGDRHSTVHIGSIRIHGTQLLLVSSNRFDFGWRSPETHSAFRFQPATACGENKSFAWICFPALKPVLVLPRYDRVVRPQTEVRAISSLQRPLAADEFQVETRNPVSANAPGAHYRQYTDPKLFAAEFDEATRQNIQSRKYRSAHAADVFGHCLFAG